MSNGFGPVAGAFKATVAYFSSFKRSTLAWGGLALGAVILLSVNLSSTIGLKAWSADLTQDRLFTISDGTRQILKSIDEPITARLYFSKNLADASPDIVRYFDRVRELFERYRDISGGKLQLTILDPEPFSDAEDKAVEGGLRGLRLNADGDVGYFGLVATNATDNQQVIPFFDPSRESYLEYDVTKLIYSLANPKKRAVGLMTSLPLDGGKSPMRQQQTQPWLMMGQIREFFDVKPIDQDVKEIPAGLDVLMVAQPTKLTPDAAYAIDQYALKGGKVLIFTDPVSDTAEMQLLQNQGNGEKELTKLLAGWGVTYDGSKVATDIKHARRVQFQNPQTGQPAVTDFVAWLGLDKSSINPKDVLSAGIDQINVASAGFLSKKDGATVDFSPILETSDSAEAVNVKDVGFGADPLALLRNYVSGGHKLVLAARLSGNVTSAFPDGPPKAADAAAKKDEKDKSAAKADTSTADAAKKDAASSAASDTAKNDQVKSGKINVIVVADTDILADQFWVNTSLGQDVAIPTAHNAAFVVGALENLSGSNALIALRGRGVKDRPFTLVEDLRRGAEQKFRAKEEALEDKLKTTQAELQKIQASGNGGSAILSDKEQETVEKFRGEMVDTRRELRSVKLALRQDIDNLGGWLKFANIALVPLMLGMAAVGVSWRRTRQRRKTPKNER
ncbi:Gldg family protein [Hyphomicrobium sp. 802]|uniref:GldG family protein n=1 Tax=Hyphomicrobium sp. 802 TaxID=1112272 RepID=UPI00045E5CB4|nr:Gldg family protein [Hyphomicrobium sp. 802]